MSLPFPLKGVPSLDQGRTLALDEKEVTLKGTRFKGKKKAKYLSFGKQPLTLSSLPPTSECTPLHTHTHSHTHFHPSSVGWQPPSEQNGAGFMLSWNAFCFIYLFISSMCFIYLLSLFNLKNYYGGFGALRIRSNICRFSIRRVLSKTVPLPQSYISP